MAATKTKKRPAPRAGSRSSSNGKANELVKRPVKRARTMVKIARVAKDAGPVLRHGGQAALDVVRRVRDFVEDRRDGLPLQASIDISMPISTVYDEWLEMESLPGTGREDVEITEEREDERIGWATEDVEVLANFHLLDDRLTRVELLMDGGPSGPLARRRINHELLRIKAYMELEVEEQELDEEDEEDVE
jgi:hypothetical protein